ncbi:hypothetical protein [Herbaspirillum rubrisubalbicans]|uniref:Uncharacterized protein n=1 Tax=Herbaspirillum rubrisubalbicans TaxID=80842 RepID=A0AAD0U699_9BURK|nr:hypothetical protein [Herbaspirillum rubrisubalbicans]AYR22617.1 hypothetical protein RC54_01765 [Herbaspirillum rubrisubalbicans]
MPNQPAPTTSLRHQLLRSACAIVIGLAALSAASHVFAAGKPGNSEYQQQIAACKSGSSTEDRATCLREAGAAQQAAARGTLTDPSPAQLKENALRRCEGLPQSDRIDCEKRVNGQGRVDGSVAEGGIFRETVTIVPAK